MGLISKIEDKLHPGHKTANDAVDSTSSSHKPTTSSSAYSQNTTSSAQHPIESNTTSNTHGLGSNTTNTHGQYGDTTSGGRHGLGSSDNPSGVPGAYPGSDSRTGHTGGLSSNVDRDGYGSSHTTDPRYGGPAATSGLGSTTTSGRDPYTSASNRDPRDVSHAPGPYGTREDYGSTGPASHTVGPHSSNAANVVDPRVRPEPEKMRDHHTVGPHQSDMANRVDPRVDSDPRSQGYSRDPDVGRQTGGMVGGSHERMENHHAIPTAGGSKVGSGEGPYDSSRSGGLTGSHGRDPYDSSSHSGGLTGSHGREPYDSRDQEPYGSHDRYGGGGIGGTSGPTTHHAGGPGGVSGGIPPERKMGGAYEAGYRDAMEHAKSEQRY